MSRLEEAEREFATELRLAADLLDGKVHRSHLSKDDLDDLAESLRDHAERLDPTPEP